MTQIYNRSFSPLRNLLRESISGVVAGLLVGLLLTIFAISYSSLIFAGPVAFFAPTAIGLALLGSIVMNLLIFVRGGIPGAIGKLQDIPSAMLAAMAATMVVTMQAGPSGQPVGPEEMALTVLAAVVLTALVVGAGFLVLGSVGLGNVIWYFPYPVIAGFLAGVGWLLVIGAISTMSGIRLTLATLPQFFDPALLSRWLPGVLLGAVIFGVRRRHHSGYTMPGMLVVGVLLFYLYLQIAGLTMADAQARGLLLGPFSAGGLWNPPPVSSWAGIQWLVVRQQIGIMLTILIVTALGQLLDLTALELTTDRFFDLNREMRVNGAGNILAGLVGSMPGYISLSLSTLSTQIAGPNRLTGLVAAGLCALLLVAGGPLLSTIPALLVGGVLVSLGLNFMYNRLIKTWRSLTRLEYVIVASIFLTIQLAGVLAGVGLGLLLAVLLFVVSYSRISVIKHTLTGVTLRSKVERPRQHLHLLSGAGDEILILQLQGFLFFGTVADLFDRISHRLDEDVSLRFVVLDFREVQGFDASAIISVARLRKLAAHNRVTMVFADANPSLRARLVSEVFAGPDDPYCRLASDVDRGVEWCENQLLQALLPPDAPDHCVGAFANLGLNPASEARVRAAVQTCSFPSGAYLIRQNAPASGIYFIDCGSVSVLLESDDGVSTRVRRAGPGSIFGEISLYAGTPTSAAVIADEPTTALFLSPAHLDAFQESDPEGAATFHRALASLMGERLAEATASIRALSR